MKFIWYWEFNPDEIEKVLEQSERFEKLVKEHPEEFPKLSEPILTGRGQGFRIIEAENEEQLMNITAFWWPFENWELVPYFNGFDYIKVWRKWNK